MKQHFSISRLHKLVERLKAHATELTQEAQRTAGGPLYLAAPPTDSARAEFGLHATKGLEKMKKALELSREVARIRTVISTANERQGINAKLALLDGLNRHIAQLKAMQNGCSTMTPFDLVAADMRMGESGASFSYFTRAQVEQLKTDIAVLQREAFGLADEIAEANATRIEVELSAEIAELVTGC